MNRDRPRVPSHAVSLAVAGVALFAAPLLGCSSAGEDRTAVDVTMGADVGADVGADAGDVAAADVGAGPELPLDVPAEALRLRAVTFNTGTGPEMAHDAEPDDGYSSAQAALSDAWYGDGLAWKPFVEETRRFFAALDADLVVFQEIFWSGECPGIPADARSGFVCADWSPGDPTVAQVVLGDGWQVACHLGKPDKCAAVNRRFGTFAGCEDDFCLEGLFGSRVPDCGSGARVGRVVVDLVAGGELTLVSVHGSSGVSSDDMDCRTQQVDQVFVDLGDGAPGVSGTRNLVMGDLNTDPGRLVEFDPSAARWLDFVGPTRPFRFITEVGEEVSPTYAGLVNIDHVVSDAFSGSCWAAGVSEGHPPVTAAVFFDHRPIVCDLVAD